MESAWLHAMGGGLIIGLAAALLLLTYGRVLGVSGIVARIHELNRNDTLWRLMFVAGLVAGGFLASQIWPDNFVTIKAGDESLKWGLAGVIVGMGTKMANGCTSGHGVCGIGRLSPRGLAATCVFILFGVITVALLGR